MRMRILSHAMLVRWSVPRDVQLSPETADLTLNPVLVIISTIPIWEEDIRVTRKWWRLFRNSSGKKGMLDKHEMRRLVEWMNSHQILTRLFGFAIATPACFILLTADYSNYTETELRQGQQFDQLWVPMAFSLFFHVQVRAGHATIHASGLNSPHSSHACLLSRISPGRFSHPRSGWASCICRSSRWIGQPRLLYFSCSSARLVFRCWLRM